MEITIHKEIQHINQTQKYVQENQAISTVYEMV